MKTSIILFVSTVMLAMPAMAESGPSKDKLLTMGLGCTALDSAAALFIDPTAVKQIKMSPQGSVTLACRGHLLATKTKPSSLVRFTETSKAAPSPCPEPASRYEETIGPDGGFKLVCYFR